MIQTLNTTKPIEEILNKKPLIISGPCSAETEEQVIATATRLAATGKVDILRAGIWKPRTRREVSKESAPKVFLGCSERKGKPDYR